MSARSPLFDASRTLDRAQAQCAEVRRTLDACIDQLSKADTPIEREAAARNPASALAESQVRQNTIRSRLREASDALSTIGRLLDHEIGERDALDRKLAAVIEQEEAARRAAFHDVLTGLPNRTLFNNRLEHGLEQAKRRGWTLAVMCLDLDGLGALNDLYGRDVGDGVLQTIARRLKVSTRGEDTVGRGGDDEFLYLLMDFRDEANIAMIAERFLRGIQTPCDITIGDRNVKPVIQARIGIAVFPKDGSGAEALLKSAEQALAKTKQLKSRFSFAS